LDAIPHIEKDIRPFVEVKIFNKVYGALLDSGAFVSCLSGEAAKEYLDQNKNFKVNNSQVETAGGKQYKILGTIKTSDTFRNQSRMLTLYIIPDLKQDLYFGVDSWYAFGLMSQFYKSICVSELKLPESLDF